MASGPAELLKPPAETKPISHNPKSIAATCHPNTSPRISVGRKNQSIKPPPRRYYWISESPRNATSTCCLGFVLGGKVHARASAEHFQKCTEFPPLRNRALGPLAVTALPIPLARRAAATVCAAVQSAVAFFRRWRPATSHYASSAAERSYGRLLRWVCSGSHQ